MYISTFSRVHDGWMDGWETPRIWVRDNQHYIVAKKKSEKWEKGGQQGLNEIGDRSHGSAKAESARHSR